MPTKRPGKNARTGKPGGIQLSPGQQGPLWAMLAEAWLMQASATDQRVSDSTAKDKWRKEYLKATVGIGSLTEIPRGGPIFARVMGKLQEIARNGIDWILKAGEANQSSLVYHARQVLHTHDIPEPYACGVARNACHLQTLPSLEDLAPHDLARVIRILHAQAPRISASAKRNAANPESEPF